MEPPPVEPPDPKAAKTFRDAVRGGNSKGTGACISFAEVRKTPLSTFKGEPALLISDEEEDLMALEFQYTLVAKFSWGRPSMNIIRKEILNAAFKGEVFTGLLDNRHILFRFDQEIDFQRMWMKKVWHFAGFQARLFRWSKEFNPEVEPSISPVWINFPLLPIHFFNPEKLYSLASITGKPLKMDAATADARQKIRPSEARICVKMDVQR